MYNVESLFYVSVGDNAAAEFLHAATCGTNGERPGKSVDWALISFISSNLSFRVMHRWNAL